MNAGRPKKRKGGTATAIQPQKKPKFLYSEEAMTEALEAVREGISCREAARRFKVPFSTLQYKVKGKVPEGRRMGPKPVLSDEEESLLAKYIVAKAKKGFPLQKRTLIETVKNIVSEDQRHTPFVNNKPGISWLRGFLKRHPQLTQCHAEVINRGRASVTEEKIRSWGKGLVEYLEEENALDILNDPKRIYNADESGFRTNPETGLVLGPVNYDNFYIIKDGSEKESISCLVTANANGDVLPPCVVYPYVRIPRHIAEAAPKGKDWVLGRSASGWMTGQVFFCYIGNSFLPWLKKENVKFPVLLLIDGHRSHLTLNVCRLCSENGILLYALLPNATHIIQPLDVSVFRPLKAGWRIVVEDWKEKSKNKVISRAQFLSLFDRVITEKATPQVIMNGFRKCGLYPYDLDAIDYSKCISDASRVSEVGSQRNFLSAKPAEFGIPHLLYLESLMGERAEEFRAKEGKEWDGEESAKELFILWKTLRRKCLESGEKKESDSSSKANEEENGEGHNSKEDETRQREEENVDEPDIVEEEMVEENIIELDKEKTDGNTMADKRDEKTDSTVEQKNGENTPKPANEKTDLINLPGEGKTDNVPSITNSNCIEERSTENVYPSTSSNQDSRAQVLMPSTSIVKTPVKIPKCKMNISPAFLSNIVWPVESPNKSKSNPNCSSTKGTKKERLPHAATSRKWLNYWEGEEDKKIKKAEEKEKKREERTKKADLKSKDKKKTKKDWICPHCKGSYNSDVSMCNGRVWVGPCNECKNWYHKKCVSKKILTEFGLDEDEVDEDTEFVCDLCYGDTEDELCQDLFGVEDNDSD